MTGLSAVQEIASVKLQARLIGYYLKYPAAYRFINFCIHFFLVIENIVVIVSSTNDKLIIILPESLSYGVRFSKIKRSSLHRSQFSCRYHNGVYRCEIRCVQCKEMVKYVSVSCPVQIKVGMV